MNAIQLKKPDGSDSGVYSCGACRLVWGDADTAERCCKCYICQEPMDKTPSGLGRCHNDCYHKRQTEAMKEQIAAAEVVEWDGEVYNDLAGGGPNDGYASDVNALVEHLESWLYDGDLKLEDWPSHAFVCDIRPLRKIDLGDILSMLHDDLPEDGEDNLKGTDELEKALKDFNEANKNYIIYEPNFKKVVKIPPPSDECLKAIKEAKAAAEVKK